MREYAFTIEYERGVYPLADVFIDHPDLLCTALTISMSRSGLWRVDRVTGSERAREAFVEAYRDPSYCIECGGRGEECDARWEHEVVAERGHRLTVYARVAEPARYCHSVPFLALRELGDGLLFDAQRRGHRYEWRVLVPEAYPVGDLFDRLSRGVGDGTSVTLRRVTTPAQWGPEFATLADLPPEQREALETAVRNGYYSTPRDVDVKRLASEMGVPGSTLRYRLRRAEGWLIESFVSEHGLLDGSADDPSTVASEGD